MRYFTCKREATGEMLTYVLHVKYSLTVKILDTYYSLQKRKVDVFEKDFGTYEIRFNFHNAQDLMEP